MQNIERKPGAPLTSRRSARLALWGCGGVVCLILGLAFFVLSAIQNMWVAIYPGAVVNEFHPSMAIVHVSLAARSSVADLYILHRYIMYMDYSSIEKGNPSQFVRLRLSCQQMLALGDADPVVLDAKLANAVDKDDVVQLRLETGRAGFVDWILASRVTDQKLSPIPASLEGFSVLKSRLSYMTTAYLLPDGLAAHSDIFLEQANGLNERNPYTENLIIDDRIYLSMLFGHSHLSQWRDLDKAARRIVARLSARGN